jgi:hypothetical protein
MNLTHILHTTIKNFPISYVSFIGKNNEIIPMKKNTNNATSTWQYSFNAISKPQLDIQ